MLVVINQRHVQQLAYYIIGFARLSGSEVSIPRVIKSAQQWIDNRGDIDDIISVNDAPEPRNVCFARYITNSWLCEDPSEIIYQFMLTTVSVEPHVSP